MILIAKKKEDTRPKYRDSENNEYLGIEINSLQLQLILDGLNGILGKDDGVNHEVAALIDRLMGYRK